MTYDINYFINKFQAIPEKEWCRGLYVDNRGRKCAIGHCNQDEKEKFALRNIMNAQVTNVNDNIGNKFLYLGNHPKTRIINKLKELMNAS